MSKRLIVLLAVVLIAALVAPALPVRAQDGGFEPPVLAACTAEERQQVNDIVLDITQQYADAANTVIPEAAADYVTLALAMNEVRGYWDGDEMDMPFCVDAYVAGSIMEFMIDNFIIAMQQSAVYFYAEEAGAADVVEKLDEYGQFHVDKVTTYQDQFTAISEVLSAETPLLDEWFPACTDADYANEIYTQLLALEDSTDAQSDALAAFLVDGTLTNDLLYFMEDLIVEWETLTDDMPQCNEVFWRELFNGILYYEIAIDLHWGALVEYTEGDLNASVLAARDAASEVILSDLEDWQAMFGEEVAAE